MTKIKSSYIDVTDQFCGAGGSSQGVRLVSRKKKLGTGLEVKLAMNHWKLAIETHNTNFPNTDHVCTDISACDPRRYPSTTILITSPECTVHSPAGGGQAKKKKFGNQLSISGKLASEEAEERSRATMWDVCRFAEYHKYELILVENVVEARKWVLFDVWLKAMDGLGYNHKIKFINSQHAHPTPQSRDRIYCVFWKKGNKEPNLEFNPIAPCGKCCRNVEAFQWWKPHTKTRTGDYGKYRTQYVYKCPHCNSVVEPYFYAAFNVIDWTKPGTRIGDKKPALKPKTLARCQYGIDKYWDEPSFINVKYSSGIECRVKSLDKDALSTQPQEQAMGVLNPCIISSRYIQGIANRVKSSDNNALPVQVTDGRESVLFPPMKTQTTQQTEGLLSPPLVLDAGWSEANPRVDVTTDQPLATQDTGQTKGLLMPALIKNYGGKPQKPVTATEAMGTVTGQDHHGLLNMPLVVENYGTSKSRPSNKSLATIATAPKHGIITQQAFNSFLSYYNNTPQASLLREEMKTIPTGDRFCKIDMPYEKPRLEDCYYRMLLPHEIQLGMAFDPDYVVLGDSKAKVKQLGNAVTPPVMEFLIERCIETLM
jgi:DNA (cytosine-5)-methyltransferase 1